MIFFVAVAVAVATVDSYMADQGYFPVKIEQAVFRQADKVFRYVDANCPQACPTRSFR